MCGGTDLSAPQDHIGKGLSPRVRGNREVAGLDDLEPGSIPACAGEPVPLRVKMPVDGVYPRVCGGTSSALHRPSRALGLSPRVRGNLKVNQLGDEVVRSIPACAGEPLRPGSPCRWVPVYPRVCGGTIPISRLTRLVSGLSPRVRGNRVLPSLPCLSQGSIPACAGEPADGAIACHR